MRKKVFGRQLKRGANSRKALFRSLLVSLVEYGKISTTHAKAKAILPEIDHLVNLAKENSTNSLRSLYADLGGNKKSVKKLAEVIAPALGGRKSGYVRTVKLGARKGDNAEMVRIEWTDQVVPEPKAKKADKKSTVKKVILGKITGSRKKKDK